MKKSDYVKDLEKKIRELEREYVDNEQILNQMAQRREAIKKDLSQLRSKLEQTKPQVLHISEHAVLRYAERFYNVPVEKIRQEIKEKMGNTEKVSDMRFAGFVIKNNTVVTYAPANESAYKKEES